MLYAHSSTGGKEGIIFQSNRLQGCSRKREREQQADVKKQERYGPHRSASATARHGEGESINSTRTDDECDSFVPSPVKGRPPLTMATNGTGGDERETGSGG